MTYYTEAWECNWCGTVIFNYFEPDWTTHHYDCHYCPKCTIKMEKEEEEEKQYQKDIESSKIKIKEPKKPPIPKWCPKVKGLYLKCWGCGRVLFDCPFPELGGKKVD